MKNSGLLSVVFLFSLSITGCVTTQPNIQQSQLQIREYQTRSYDSKDVKMIMKSVMSTLQDDGFIVKQANIDLGLLTATKEIDVKDNTEAFINTLFAGAQARYKRNSIIESSANITEYGDQTRVRINFQQKVLDNQGGVMKVEQVGDGKFYQDFFSKVDKGVFLSKEKL